MLRDTVKAVAAAVFFISWTILAFHVGRHAQAEHDQQCLATQVEWAQISKCMEVDP